MEIRKNYSLLPHNTFGMDVKASLFIEYSSVEELKTVLRDYPLTHSSWLHVGEGSNLLFSDEFIADYIPEWKQLSTVFGKAGRVVTLSPEQTALCKSRILEIQAEKDPFRQRLMILCLLSLIAEIAGTEENDGTEIPRFVSDALTYISTNYAKKILASELAWSLGVGRTTLMTAFKKYIGCTLNDYVIRFRVKSALRLLREGKTEQEAAEVCGFSDTCSLIRSFKRCYGKTPKQYLLAEK